MKTIKEKAQEYDRLKALISKCRTDKYGCIIGIKPSDMFQELAESKDEDEKIRKMMIKFFESCGNLEWYGGLTPKNAIDWLKKQGYHINFINKIQKGDQVTRNEDGTLVNLSQLKRVAKKVTEDKESAIKFLKSAGIMDSNGELSKEYRQEYK